MKQLHLLLILAALWGSNSLLAQNTHLKKANKLFKLDRFAEAIDHYEAGLVSDASLSAQTKLAYCYRMTNRTQDAERVYAEIVVQERAKPITVFYYAESLMGNGKYDEARSWFLKYKELNPKDERASEMVTACERVKFIEPYFGEVQITSFPHNSSADEHSALYFRDGIVFSSDRESRRNLLKQKSGWTGRDYQRIYYSEHTAAGQFSVPQGFSKKLNELNKHCGPVTFDGAGQLAVFTRTGIHAARDEVYHMQLYSAVSENGTRWKKVKRLSFCKKEHNYMHPALSPDGQYLYFVSDRPGGQGGTDLYVSERKGKEWSRPRNLGPTINTSGHEGFPFVATDGKLYFCSKGHTGFGGFDIYFSTVDPAGNWTEPVNVGPPINSSYDDISISLRADTRGGLFSSSREGGDDDIYFFQISDQALANTHNDEVTTKTEGQFVPIPQTVALSESPARSSSTNDASLESEILEPKGLEYEVEAPYEGSSLQIVDVADSLEVQAADAPAPLDDQLIDALQPEMMDHEIAPANGIAIVDDFLQRGRDIRGESYTIPGIEYAPGSFLLSGTCTRALLPLVDLLNKYPRLRLEISGHTSSPGTAADNQKLSQQRAQAIVAYLMYKGVPRDRLDAVGYGESLLLNQCADGVNCSEAAHKVNERIEIRVLDW